MVDVMDEIIEEVKAKRKQIEMMYLLFQHKNIDTTEYDKLTDELAKIDDVFFDIECRLKKMREGM
jgi:hypothetical protein